MDDTVAALDEAYGLLRQVSARRRAETQEEEQMARQTTTAAPADEPDEREEIFIGSHTEEREVPVDAIDIDDSYQRRLNPKWVAEIARDYQEWKFRKPLLARRPGGKYVAVCGQHRLAALNLRYPPDKYRLTVLCEVLPESTVEQEATIFVSDARDTRRPIPFDTFKARLRGNEERAHKLLAIVEGAGFGMQVRDRPQESGLLKCISMMDRIAVNATGEEMLAEILGVCYDAWEGETEGMTRDLLEALHSFLRKYQAHPRYRRDRLVDTLHRKGGLNLHQQVKKDALGKERYGRTITMRTTILLAYQEGISRDELLEAE